MSIENTFNLWKTDHFFDEDTRKEVSSLKDKKEITDRFYKELEFGTGGLRGIMEAGTNRINDYIVRKATTGFATYLIEKYGDDAKKRGVAIGMDSRNNSASFAMSAALTLCEKGIKTFLFDQVSPTPLLSFSVRYLNCCGGIVITASHNPKEYNGYKAYNDKGCQLLPDEAEEVIKKVNAVKITETKIMNKDEALRNNLLIMIGDDVLDSYCDKVIEVGSEIRPSEIKVVYSPLHGSGNIPVRKVLKRRGFEVYVVPEQEKPNGNFPTVPTPNPENGAALALGIELAKKKEADVVLGTDPDSDRVGIAVRTKSGDYKLFSGAQTGALLTQYVIMRRIGKLSGKETVVKTIVTDELGVKVAKKYGLRTIDVLTGFKYIGEKIDQMEQDGSGTFLFGYEESYGYLCGTYARDKDAVVASMLICEMAAWWKAQGFTLEDALQNLYAKYGKIVNSQDSFVFKGKEGAEKMASLMEYFRKIGKGIVPDAIKFVDYNTGVGDLPKANVLKYVLDNDMWIAIRPSGTEPKIKVYYSVDSDERLEEMRKIFRNKING